MCRTYHVTRGRCCVLVQPWELLRGEMRRDYLRFRFLDRVESGRTLRNGFFTEPLLSHNWAFRVQVFLLRLSQEYQALGRESNKYGGPINIEDRVPTGIQRRSGGEALAIADGDPAAPYSQTVSSMCTQEALEAISSHTRHCSGHRLTPAVMYYLDYEGRESWAHR